MPRRFGTLTAVALALTLAASEARAHRLDAQAMFLPDRKKVQIESWFDNGQLARGAKVQVFREDGRLLAEGVLDQEARFVFAVHRAEPLRVVVNAGGGHRKEFDIAAEELQRSLPIPAAPAEEEAPPRSEPPAPVVLGERHDGEQRVKDILIGVGFLLALAAFVLSVRNARQLKSLNRSEKQCHHPGGVPNAGKDLPS
jgi:nickel transport protein